MNILLYLLLSYLKDTIKKEEMLLQLNTRITRKMNTD